MREQPWMRHGSHQMTTLILTHIDDNAILEPSALCVLSALDLTGDWLPDTMTMCVQLLSHRGHKGLMPIDGRARPQAPCHKLPQARLLKRRECLLSRERGAPRRTLTSRLWSLPLPTRVTLTELKDPIILSRSCHWPPLSVTRLTTLTTLNKTPGENDVPTRVCASIAFREAPCLSPQSAWVLQAHTPQQQKNGSLRWEGGMDGRKPATNTFTTPDFVALARRMRIFPLRLAFGLGTAFQSFFLQK